MCDSTGPSKLKNIHNFFTYVFKHKLSDYKCQHTVCLERPWVDPYCCCNERGNLLDSTNLLCYSSGTQKLKVGLPGLKSRQDRVPSRSARRESASWPYPVSRSHHTPWVLPHPLFTAANPLSRIISLVLCPWERFSDFKESWDHFVSTQLIQNDLRPWC